MTEVTRKPAGEVSSKRKRRPVGRPKGTRITVLPLEQLSAISVKMGVNGAILTFRDLQRELANQRGVRVGLGTLQRYASGTEPTRASVRRALGLPPIEKVQACPSCGVVHVKKCPVKPTPPAWVTAAADWLLARALRERR